MTLLTVKDLSVAFKPLSEQQTSPTSCCVEQVSFSLHHGEMLALVGESGSGKSITALSIAGLLPYPQAFHPSGSILLDQEELLNRGENFLTKIRGKRIGYIFQDPMTALNPLHTVFKQIAEPLRIHCEMNESQLAEKVKDLLNLVGFVDFEDRLHSLPHQLSGGQRQRVMIAMAIACEPDLLIADEPTTALDVTLQVKIMDLIKELQNKLKMSILLISHDLHLVSHYAERLMVMQNGRLVEEGPTKQILKYPKHPYTQKLIQSEPERRQDDTIQSQEDILNVHSLDVRYQKSYRSFLSYLFQKEPERLQAVHDVSFQLKKGQTLGIVGESGSGKSTLCLATLKLIQSQGDIFVDQKPWHLMTEKQIRPFRSAVQVIFQDPFSSLNPRFNVEQIIGEGLKWHQPNLSKEVFSKAIDDILIEVGLEPKMKYRYPHEFSGGQRQRIAIARAIILKPKILFLDEPTSALDRSIQAEILNLLQKMQQTYHLSCVFISHDLRVIHSMCHWVMVMKNGRIIEQGLTSQIFESPQETYTKELLKASFFSKMDQ